MKFVDHQSHTVLVFDNLATNYTSLQSSWEAQENSLSSFHLSKEISIIVNIQVLFVLKWFCEILWVLACSKDFGKSCKMGTSPICFKQDWNMTWTSMVLLSLSDAMRVAEHEVVIECKWIAFTDGLWLSSEQILIKPLLAFHNRSNNPGFKWSI